MEAPLVVKMGNNSEGMLSGDGTLLIDLSRPCRGLQFDSVPRPSGARIIEALNFWYRPNLDFWLPIFRASGSGDVAVLRLYVGSFAAPGFFRNLSSGIVRASLTMARRKLFTLRHYPGLGAVLHIRVRAIWSQLCYTALKPSFEVSRCCWSCGLKITR